MYADSLPRQLAGHDWSKLHSADRHRRAERSIRLSSTVKVFIGALQMGIPSTTKPSRDVIGAGTTSATNRPGSIFGASVVMSKTAAGFLADTSSKIRAPLPGASMPAAVYILRDASTSVLSLTPGGPGLEHVNGNACTNREGAPASTN